MTLTLQMAVNEIITIVQGLIYFSLQPGDK